MSRRNSYKLAAFVAVMGVAAFAWGRNTHDTAGQPTEFTDLWQWHVGRINPQPSHYSVRVVLRSRFTPVGESIPMPGGLPLGPTQGFDRTLAHDFILDERPKDCRLTVQIIDLRQLGLTTPESEAPLRLQGVFSMYGSQAKIAAKVNGHSYRGRPVVHPGGWVDGERPLLSFITAGAIGYHENTILLSTHPDDEYW